MQHPDDEKNVKLTTEDIIAVINKTKSLSVIMKDALEKMKKVFDENHLKDASK